MVCVNHRGSQPSWTAIVVQNNGLISIGICFVTLVVCLIGALYIANVLHEGDREHNPEIVRVNCGGEDDDPIVPPAVTKQS